MRTVQLSINNSFINSMQHFKDKNCQKSKLLFMKLLFFLTLFILMFSSCKKNKNSNCYSTNGKGRIIGYHPCANYVQANRLFGAGFVVEIDKTTKKDTVETFQIPEGFFIFKPEYIDASYSSYLFKPEVQDIFKITFAYKIAEINQKTNIVCNGMVNTADYTASIRNREILISCILKQ